MDPPNLPPSLLPTLSSQIDTLTSALQPLLTTPLSTTTSTLPLLSRAKLHIHVAYTIESLLYSSLLLSGQNPREHAIFAELARLKGYFQKVKEIEERGLKSAEAADKEGKEKEEGRMRLDKEAAGRFVRAGLAGNEQFDREREEREKGIRERTKRKADALGGKQKKHIKFDEDEENRRMAALPKETRGTEGKEDESADDEEEADEVDGDQDAEMQDAINAAYDESNTNAPSTSKPPQPLPHRKKRSKTRDENRAERRERKLQRQAQRAAEASNAGNTGEEEETLIPAKQQGAPRTPGETFKALLEGPLKKDRNGNGNGKGQGSGKRKGR
ncbi:uncharacterized protein EI97DRAFT_434654 [Westerdykella ornata]|uniref:Exosome complex protein n=1 Tax=Westerdykella ornata TaxID=318751 RepID=A0A6A6JHG2_WESOR|nr:uncharacterized protein EI97DRAFT_434654 [Westerdykella ornata]KAF2275086.1 hypothetical protein EI97DRAFT_434654 [Westerdykella ornata]